MIRLLKPLEHYHVKYGTWQYGFQKLYLLMEKQHNRGQEGAGMACVRLNGKPGHEYMYREKASLLALQTWHLWKVAKSQTYAVGLWSMAFSIVA